MRHTPKWETGRNALQRSKVQNQQNARERMVWILLWETTRGKEQVENVQVVIHANYTGFTAMYSQDDNFGVILIV